eukprot:g565.t1
MCFGSKDIVIRLLDAGCDVNTTDLNGNDALMIATSFGRVDHVNLWLNRFKTWDLKRKNKTNGANVLCIAASDIQNHDEQLEIMQRLVKQGADMKTSFTNSGASVLHELCRNLDATAEVCRWILSVEPDLRERKRSPQTLKWKLKSSITKMLLFTGGFGLLDDAPSETALEEAIRQGNIPIVDVLRDGCSLIENDEEEEVDL